MKGTWGWTAGCALAASALAGCGSLDSSQGGGGVRAGLMALRITEIHYHPLGKDTISGDEYEFVEIKNTGEAVLDLTGVGFTAGVAYAFPEGSELEAGSFRVIAASAGRFKERYGFSPDGVFEGRLGNSGEKVTLEDIANHAVIEEVAYLDGGDWPASADGGGCSLVPRGDSAGNRAADWRASYKAGGSPGRDDGGAVVINEVLSHTDPPAVDAIELYNTDDASVDIGGWWLSDDSADPAKFRIPAGTVLAGHGYAYFDERDFNPDSASDRSFRLGSHGDDVWLSAESGGCKAGYCDGVAFGEMPNGVTVGRYLAGDGSVHFTAQKRASLGEANAGPRVGPLIVTEIMYHSPNDTDDFLELANVAGQPLDLFDRDRPANTWKIEGLGFAFPEGITLEAGETVLVLPVRASEDRIRAAYRVPPDVRVFQSDGDLKNGSETLAVLKPEEPYPKPDAAPGDSTVPYQIIDQVTYRDGGAWPDAADGEGKSLARRSKESFGDDATAWTAEDPGPGK